MIDLPLNDELDLREALLQRVEAGEDTLGRVVSGEVATLLTLEGEVSLPERTQELIG